MRDYFDVEQLSIVGVIPAAGLGSRLQPLAFSKELLPIGFAKGDIGNTYPKVVSSYLLDQMGDAGAEQVYFILRKGKWDIPAYFGNGSNFGLCIAYLIMGLPYGASFSVDQAYNFVKDKYVLFGFPDILISEQIAFKKLLSKQYQTGADVVLGIFEVDEPLKWDVVDFDPDGTVKSISPKPHESNLSYAWAFACWGPAFTEFMNQYVRKAAVRIQSGSDITEISIGMIIQAAILSGLSVQSVPFKKGICLDIGTPEDLRKAILRYS